MDLSQLYDNLKIVLVYFVRFSVALTEQGLISEVFYPPDETMATVALKKSISSLFSLDEGEMRTDGTRLVVTTTKTDSSQIHAKLTNKVSYSSTAVVQYYNYVFYAILYATHSNKYSEICRLLSVT